MLRGGRRDRKAPKPIKVPTKAKPSSVVRKAARSSPDARVPEKSPRPLTPVRAGNAPPFLVAAVGASAGGLVAFSNLLRQMPADAPLALVLVQHLSPDHRSLLPELLGATTKLAVETGRDGLAIRPSHVYVIPPNTHMTVTDGHLRIRPRPLPRMGAEGPVDVLFRSVAEQYRDKAVGVVLSGSAHDGAAGIRAIKGAGGITMVQAPHEAEIDGMPRAAIATEAVDAVLPVQEIAEQLLRLSVHPFFRESADSGDAELERPTVSGNRRRLFQLLRRATGVDFNNYKSPTITRRIHRRMALHRLSTLDEYVAHVDANRQELERLQEDLLIHVTSFFRDAKAFEALQQTLEGVLGASDGEAPFRAWIPGCSSGEEVYSVAMAILELLGERAKFVPLQLFGTDVSNTSVERARTGVYSSAMLADVSAERLRRFFVPFDGGYRVSKAVRDCCVFARQDVTRDPPFSRLDLVVCRNLLIYLTQPAQRKLMAVFHYALKPNGIVMLGRSETIGNNGDMFAVVDKKAQLYQRKQGLPRMAMDFVAPEAEPADPAKKSLTQRHGRQRPEWDVQNEANRFLLDHYAPPAVVVDEDLRITRARGNTGRYLQLPSGDVSFDLLKMVRAELLFGLRALLQESKARGTPVGRDGFKVREGNEWHVVNLRVVPLGSPGPSGPRQFLVLFDEPNRGKVSPAAPVPGPVKHADKQGAVTSRQKAGVKASKKSDGKGGEKGDHSGQSSAMASDLQHELVETRYQLQSIIDDLAAANEELQSSHEEALSSNEELQSTNEELDTAKEELQSSNEELTTLNDELHGRNEELARTNSDVVNLLNSVQIPIVMVGPDLRIRRFSPAAERALNIIHADIGRPIGHVKPNFPGLDIEPLMANVIDGMTVHESEVESHDGRVFALQIRPYRNVDNRIDGAVMALIDQSVPRSGEDLSKLAERTAEAILATTRDPMLLLDGRANVRTVNRAFVDFFQIPASEVEGRSIHAIDGGTWDHPQLRKLLERDLPRQKSLEGFVWEHEFPRIGRRSLEIDARRLDLAGASPIAVMVIRGAAGDSQE